MVYETSLSFVKSNANEVKGSQKTRIQSTASALAPERKQKHKHKLAKDAFPMPFPLCYIKLNYYIVSAASIQSQVKIVK